MALIAPLVRLSVDGGAVSSELYNRLSSVELVDEEGSLSDRLVLEINNHDLAIASLPKKGVTLKLELGAGEVAYNKGEFVVDGVGGSGPPHRLTVQAQAVATGGFALREVHSRSWRVTTLGAVFGDVAAGAGVKLAIDPAVMVVAVAELHQIAESDAAFVDRVARQWGLVAKVADGALRVSDKAGKTASGGGAKVTTQLPWSSVARYDFDAPDAKARYAAVEAYCWMTASCAREKVSVGSGKPVLTLAQVFYNDKPKARAACQARLTQLGREGFALNLTLCQPRLDVYAGNFVQLDDAPAFLRGKYVLVKARHVVNSTFTSRLELQAAG